MSDITYGVELPTGGGGGGGGGGVNSLDLALAKGEIPASTSYTIPTDFQYIRHRNLTVTGTLTIDGELVLL